MEISISGQPCKIFKTRHVGKFECVTVGVESPFVEIRLPVGWHKLAGQGLECDGLIIKISRSPGSTEN